MQIVLSCYKVGLEPNVLKVYKENSIDRINNNIKTKTDEDKERVSVVSPK